MSFIEESEERSSLLEKEKTMSISKHVDDHNSTGIAQSNCTGVAMSLVPLWFPWWFYVVFDSLLGSLRFCSFDKEHSLGVMPMHDVGLQVLFSVAALLNLVFSLFFRLMSPLSKDETGRACSPCNSCDVVIIDMLADRHCSLLFYLNRYGSPPGVAISLVPLWLPW